MFLIILSWIYISAILYLNGSLFIGLVKKAFRLQTDKTIHFTVVCIAGMAFTTFLVATLCLFIPIDFIANLIVFAIAALYFLYKRKIIIQQFKYFREQIKNTPTLIKVLFICYLFTISIISAMPSSHYDDGLYYSGSIKWLQEYGTVPGLANLNPRLAFNSSWMMLQSLFGFHLFSGKLLNDLNGLLYVLVFAYSLQGVSMLLKGDRTLLIFVRTLFFLPVLALHFPASHDFILYNINLFSSPSPDVPASFIMWMIFLLFLENQPDQNLLKLKQVLIVLFTCFLFTIKLSVVPIVIFILFILWTFLKQKQFKIVALTIAGCVVYMVPWLARNVIISGYIIFPFAKLDFFSFDWKLPIDSVKWHENAIRIWAINPEYDLSKELQVPFSEWFPGWFERLTYIQSVIIIFIVLFTIIWSVIFLYGILKKGYPFLKTNAKAIIFIITSLVGIAFWFYKGPDLRLGFGFCIFFCMFGISAFIKYFTDNFTKQVALSTIFLSYLIFAVSYMDIWTNAPLKRMAAGLPEYPLPQQRDSIPLSPTINLYLTKNEACWNCSLPCTMDYEYGVLRPVLRGKTLKEGFKVPK